MRLGREMSEIHRTEYAMTVWRSYKGQFSTSGHSSKAYITLGGGTPKNRPIFSTSSHTQKLLMVISKIAILTVF